MYNGSVQYTYKKIKDPLTTNDENLLLIDIRLYNLYRFSKIVWKKVVGSKKNVLIVISFIDASQ